MNKDRIKTFADKVYLDIAGAMATGMAYIGVEKGIFRAMAGKGPMTKETIVVTTGLQDRYVQEWLSGITTAGYLEYDPEAMTFMLPDEHSYLVASEGTDHFMGGLFHATPVLLSFAPKVADAFEKGGDFGGQRPWFVCPVFSNGQYCGRRVALLYGAGELFACRRCYGLAYASQREAPMHRGLLQAQKVRMRLGGSADLFEAFPEKPKRMHWRTYKRLREAYDLAAERPMKSLTRFVDGLQRRVQALEGGIPVRCQQRR